MATNTTLLDRIKGASRKKLALGTLGLLIAIVLPQLGITKDIEGPLPIATVVLMAVYALFALGLNIVVGFAGLLDLGFVAFFLFGAYVSAWLMSDFAIQVTGRGGAWEDLSVHFFSTAKPETLGIHISFWLVIIVAAVVAAIAGVIIGWPTLKLKSDYLALVTLGFGEILPELFRNSEKFPIGGYNLTNGTKGIGPIDAIGLGFHTIGKTDYKWRYYVIMVFCGLFVWISVALRDGRLGRAWMAIREDELAASLMGVPLRRTKLWSYAVGAVAGGVGGAFYATIVGTVNVDTFTFQFSIIILCAVILGGMGNVWGAIVGAAIITWLSDNGLKWGGLKLGQLFGNDKGWNLVQFQFAFFGIILVLMMLFRPEGIIPAARSKEVKQAEKAAQTAGATA
ncbi:MAG: hypothetical protein RI900_829 [Actinomycetota bacterium]|jgi:branched-chain amino acid transport system permease protein